MKEKLDENVRGVTKDWMAFLICPCAPQLGEPWHKAWPVPHSLARWTSSPFRSLKAIGTISSAALDNRHKRILLSEYRKAS